MNFEETGPYGFSHPGAIRPSQITLRHSKIHRGLGRKPKAAIIGQGQCGASAAEAASGRQPALRRVLIDGVGQILRQTGKDVFTGQARLLRQGVQNVRSDSLLELLGSDLFVRSGANPRIGNFTVAVLLEPLDQLT
jgi:hypothetical protein